MTSAEAPAPATIRTARPDDAPAIANAQVRSWQWAYRGLISDAYLAHFAAGEPERSDLTRGRIARPEPGYRWWVAERAGKVVGFATTGPSRDADAAQATGEVLALYLAPEATGMGIGRLLFAVIVADLRHQGYRAATLWVLEGNARARRFYEAAGWRGDGATREEQRPGATLAEVRYRVALASDAP